MAPALTSPAPAAPHTLSTTTTKAPKAIFPDGIKTSGQHEPVYSLLHPYSKFPKEITGSTAWDKTDYESNPERWTHIFSSDEVREMSEAADNFIASGTPLTGITKDLFPLPNFSKFLEPLRKELIDGKGFILFKGMPVEQWGNQKSAVAYMGLGTYLGYFVSQNSRGHVLGHVKDLGEDATAIDKVRIYRTNARQYFHADDSDLVGLLCVAKALEGGESDLVSSHSVWNELQKNHPDVAELLTQPIWYFDRKGETSVGQKEWIKTAASNLTESSEVENDGVHRSDHTIEGDQDENDAPDYGLGRGIKSSWKGDKPARGRSATVTKLEDEERDSSVPLSESTEPSSRGTGRLVDVELASTERGSIEELDPQEAFEHKDEPPPSYQQFRNMPRNKRLRSPLRTTLPIPQETEEDEFLERPRSISPDRQTVPDLVPENPTTPPRHNFFWAELFIIVQCAMIGVWFISFLQDSPPGKKNPLGDTVYTVLQSSFHLIGVYSLVSVIVGLLWLSLLRSFARPLVYLMLVAVPIISFSFWLYPFISSLKGSWHGNSAQDKAMRWLSFGPLILAVFWVYTAFKARHSLHKAIGMLEFSSDILRAQAPLLMVGVATLAAVMLWSWLWILMFTRLFLGGHFASNKSRWIVDASTWWLGIAFFLNYFWTLGVIAGVQRATTAATVSQWYFHRNTTPTPPASTVVQASLTHASYTMAGTICLSTLISLAVRLPLIVLPRRIAGMIAMCAYSIVPTPIATLTNPLTLTFASIHGVPLNQAARGLSQMNFISAASPTTTLGPSSFKNHGRPSIQSYRLAKLLLHAIRWLITITLGFGGWVSTARMLQIGNETVPYKGSLYAYVVGIISAAIGWGALGAMEGVLGGILDAVLVCWGSEVGRDGQGEARYCVDAGRLFGDEVGRGRARFEV